MFQPSPVLEQPSAILARRSQEALYLNFSHFNNGNHAISRDDETPRTKKRNYHQAMARLQYQVYLRPPCMEEGTERFLDLGGISPTKYRESNGLLSLRPLYWGFTEGTEYFPEIGRNSKIRPAEINSPTKLRRYFSENCLDRSDFNANEVLPEEILESTSHSAPARYEHEQKGIKRKRTPAVSTGAESSRPLKRQRRDDTDEEEEEDDDDANQQPTISSPRLTSGRNSSSYVSSSSSFETTSSSSSDPQISTSPTQHPISSTNPNESAQATKSTQTKPVSSRMVRRRGRRRVVRMPRKLVIEMRLVLVTERGRGEEE